MCEGTEAGQGMQCVGWARRGQGQHRTHRGQGAPCSGVFEARSPFLSHVGLTPASVGSSEEVLTHAGQRRRARAVL